MDTILKPGDVVVLKSGGPKLTLDSRSAGGDWIAKWFEGTSLKRGVFSAETLKKVEKTTTLKTNGFSKAESKNSY
jgi:uncharacterized protein YodC (DUF2158 family)